MRRGSIVLMPEGMRCVNKCSCSLLDVPCLAIYAMPTWPSVFEVLTLEFCRVAREAGGGMTWF